MEMESVSHCGWAIMTFVAYQAQPVVHHLQVVDHCPLVLALLPTPGAVAYAAEAAKGVQVMYSHQSHTLWDSEGGTTQRNLRPLGKDLRA